MRDEYIKWEEQTTAALTAMRANVPVLLLGVPGIAKTAFLKAATEALGWDLYVFMGSIRQPSDIIGYLAPDMERRVTLELPLEWAWRIGERATQGHTTVMFLEELTTVFPAMQAAQLRFVHERRVGDCHLGDSTRIVAAANPPEMAPGGFQLAPPMANRMVHLQWVADPMHWADNMLLDFPAPSLPVFDEAKAKEARDRWKALIHAYIKGHRQEHLVAMPQDSEGRVDEEKASGPWASERSWYEYLLPCLAWLDAAQGLSKRLYESVRERLATGSIGAVGAEFLLWADNLDLTSAEDMLRQGSKYVVPDRQDKAYAELANLAIWVSNRDITPEVWKGAWAVFAAAAEQGKAAMAAAAVKSLAAQATPALPPVYEEIKAFRPLLEAAKLIPRSDEMILEL